MTYWNEYLTKCKINKTLWKVNYIFVEKKYDHDRKVIAAAQV